MPVCKNCGARLNKLDNDICPVCGQKKPLEGVTSETVELTSDITMNEADYKEVKPLSRIITMVIFMLVGFTGAGYYYLRKYKVGLIWMAAHLAFIGGIGALFAYAIGVGPLVGFMFSIGSSYIVNIIAGLYFLFTKDLKDGRGEFIR